MDTQREATVPEIPMGAETSAGWKVIALERLPIPYRWTAVALVLFAVFGQALDYTLDNPALYPLNADVLTSKLVLIVLFVYVLVFMRVLKREGLKCLVLLRPVVETTDARYDDCARRMINATGLVEMLLSVVSVVVVVGLFLLPPSELLAKAAGQRIPALFVAVISLNYVLLGWLLLSLVYAAIRYARGLRCLAGQPLAVNAFDPTNLLPAGRLSLLYSMAAAGLVLIPLVLLGPPTRGGYVVIPLSIATLLALFVPLWGVHRQINATKHRVLRNIHDQLMQVQVRLLDLSTPEAQELVALSQRTTTLVSLRTLIVQAPSWPFRNEAAIFRATVAALSPLVYVVLTQLVIKYVVPLFGR